MSMSMFCMIVVYVVLDMCWGLLLKMLILIICCMMLISTVRVDI